MVIKCVHCASTKIHSDHGLYYCCNDKCKSFKQITSVFKFHEDAK